MSLHIEPGPPPAYGRQLRSWEVLSRVDGKTELIDEIMIVVREHAWVPGDEEHWLCLCLDEAIVNAMLHGNEGDPELSIRIELWEDEERWAITVSDQGEGFSGEDVPDPEDEESLMLEHGRGILIMSQWLDELTYYNGGSCVAMVRRKVSSSEAGAD